MSDQMEKREVIYADVVVRLVCVVSLGNIGYELTQPTGPILRDTTVSRLLSRSELTPEERVRIKKAYLKYMTAP